MRSLTVLILSFALASVAAAQAKPAAGKFDEFSLEGYSTEESRETLMKQRAERVTKHLRAQRGRQLMIIGYRGREAKADDLNGYNLAQRFRNYVGYEGRMNNEIEVVDGGVREFATIELWIAAKGVEMPKPSPTFPASEAVDCPRLAIDTPEFNYAELTLRFRVDASIAKRGDLQWAATGGNIIERHPDGITIKAENGLDSRAVVYLESPGVPVPCENRTSRIAYFRVEPRLLDRFGRIANGDLRARLDYFFTELSNNPQAQGVIHIYGGRSLGNQESAAFERLIRNHTKFRRFDLSRVTIVQAGFREEPLREFWIVGPSAENPAPRPSVDRQFTGTPAARKK